MISIGADGVVAGPHGWLTMDEIAKVAHLRMDGLPAGVDPLLDATATYEPAIKIGHLHTPHTEYGMKGMGEGGAAPPAAIDSRLWPIL